VGAVFADDEMRLNRRGQGRRGNFRSTAVRLLGFMTCPYLLGLRFRLECSRWKAESDGADICAARPLQAYNGINRAKNSDTDNTKKTVRTAPDITLRLQATAHRAMIAIPMTAFAMLAFERKAPSNLFEREKDIIAISRSSEIITENRMAFCPLMVIRSS